MISRSRQTPLWILFIFIMAFVFLQSCGGDTSPSAPTETHTPERGHPEEEHEVVSGPGGVTSLVLIRRLDGVNKHEGGPGVIGERFGISATVEDMDGDGSRDIIVGSPRADVSGVPGANEGEVYVYSGAALLKGLTAEEALLYRVQGEATTNGTGELGFRQSIAAADLNQDGLPELLVGAWRADPIVNGLPRVDGGTIFVFDGAALHRGMNQNEAVLFRLDGEAGSRLGRPVAMMGDINRDGVPDFFIGAHRASYGSLTNAGIGYLISGADFSILHQFHGEAANDFMGRSVMALGDLNGDSYIDLAVGASQGDGGQAGGLPTSAGYVNIYSGKDYSLIHRLTPPLDEPTGAFGQTTVYTLSPDKGVDFNGDAVPDIIVGSPEARGGLQGPEGKEGYPRTGSVYVYSGTDFSLLYRFNGERGSAKAGPSSHESPESGTSLDNIGDVFGDAIAVVSDLDGDDVPEIVIGSPRGDGQSPDGLYPLNLQDSGYVKVFSGREGISLVRFSGAGNGTNMGHNILGVPDVNGDGTPDLLIGSDLTDYGGVDAGSLYWYSVRVNNPVE